MIDFKPWPKIPRNRNQKVTITEKIDGTNACVVIEDGEIVAVQSRRRFITPDDDNFGFARWVENNKECLLTLGDGHHYGEWAGPGIQDNPLKLEERTFFLFNVFRFAAQGVPKCCDVVPTLYVGDLQTHTVDMLLEELAEDPKKKHEGVVIYQHSTKTMTKETIDNPLGKWTETK